MKQWNLESESLKAAEAFQTLKELGSGVGNPGNILDQNCKYSISKYFIKYIYPSLTKLPPPKITTSQEVRKLFPVSLQKRLRFRGDFTVYLYSDPIRSYAFSFYHYILLRAHKHTIIELYKLADLVEESAALGDYAFKHGELFDKDWHLYTHLKRLCDYTYNSGEQFMIDEVKYWVKPKQHWYPGSDFRTVFREELRYLLFGGPGGSDNPSASGEGGLGIYSPSQCTLTTNQFLLNRTLWANNGSGFMGRGYKYPKDLKNYSHTKWARAWTMSDSEITSYFFAQRNYECKVQQKPEIAKKRCVIAADLQSYLHMKFVWDSWLKHCLQWPEGVITLNNVEKWNMWSALSKFDKEYSMPVDQSEFDQMQDKWCVQEIIRQLKTVAPGEVAEVLQMIHDGFDRTYIIIPTQRGDVVIKYEWGVLSGWFWTAFFDTILNHVTFRMARRLSMSVGLSTHVKRFFCQGDDDDLRLTRLVDCAGLYLSYLSMGFKVNKQKFYVSRTRDEFLRRRITNKDVSGYPARSIASILWSSPERTVGDVKDITNRVGLWKKLSDRLGVNLVVFPVARDLMGFTGLSRSDIQTFLNTPRQFGGVGIGIPHLNINNEIKCLQLKFLPDESPISVDLPGWADTTIRFGTLNKNLVTGTLVKNTQKYIFKKKTILRKIPTKPTYKYKSFVVDNGQYEELKYNGRLIRPEYLPEIGQTLGEALGLEPLNGVEIRTRFSGFTSKLLDQILKGTLALSLPLVQGFSEEYLSALCTSNLLGLVDKLRCKHRATYYDFLMSCYWLGETLVCTSYRSSE